MFFAVCAMPVWHGEQSVRKIAIFSAGFRDTTDLLRVEVERLGARECEIHLGVEARDLPSRLSADQKVRHPGVAVVFSSRHGRLRYACDRFDRWPDNLRAIALTLERLRKAELYGVVARGEQYQGFLALPGPAPETVPGNGNGNGSEIKTLDDAVGLLSRISGYSATNILAAEDVAKLAYRQSVRLVHPDVTGDEKKFEKLEAAWKLIRAHFA